MTHSLKNDEGVDAILDGNIVLKTVRGLNSSGYCDMVYPEEMIEREIKALKLLKDVNGIQKLIERVSPVMIYTKYMDGKSLRDWKGPLADEYFNKLYLLTKECVDRGVYRLGHTQKDFLVRPSGDPGIIDFGNVLFSDDPVAKSMITAARVSSLRRIHQLRRRFVDKRVESSSIKNFKGIYVVNKYAGAHAVG